MRNGHKSILKERFKINSIGICGSYVRKEQKAKSDIDILIKMGVRSQHLTK